MAIFHMLTGPGDQSLRYQPDENICPYAAGRQKRDLFGGPPVGENWDIFSIIKFIKIYGYGSIRINTIFRGMNIHLPAILRFTRGTRF